MAIVYCGDLHGRSNDIGRIVQKAEARGDNYIVQVGDFGTFFPSNSERKLFKKDGIIRGWKSNDTSLDAWIKKRARQGKWTTKILTCGGNHDNWTILDQLEGEQGYPNMVELVPESGVYYVPRGTTVDIDGISHLFLGGAESTDKYHRIEGLDLWNNREEASNLEFEKFSLALEEHKPDTVVTHDAPARVEIYRMRRGQSITSNTLETILSLSDYKPKNWVFGHHHLLERWKVEGTKFFCCGLHGQYWKRLDISGWDKWE
jgi:Icc-related predicted phosphoesterase